LLADVSEDPMVNNWLLKYEDIEIVEHIGGGAEGEVYKGVYADTVVAVKKLKEGLIEFDRDVHDFCNEIRVLSSLRSPNVVMLIGACVTPPNVCIVSEYLHRKNLRTVLEDTTIRLDLSKKVMMIMDLCRGMAAVHEKNIIHRDLKPENLFISQNFVLKVGDFGASKMKPFGSKTNRTGFSMSIAGTSYYLAPEVYQGKYSFSVDVYAAGVTMWEIYTRQMAGSSGIHEDSLIQGDRPPIPLTCPPVLAILISECWDQDPSLRPTFSKALRVLRAWYEGGLMLDFKYAVDDDDESTDDGDPHSASPPSPRRVKFSEDISQVV